MNRSNQQKVFLGGTKRTIKKLSILRKLDFINCTFLADWKYFVHHSSKKKYLPNILSQTIQKNFQFYICQKTVKNNGFSVTDRFWKTKCRVRMSFVCWTRIYKHLMGLKHHDVSRVIWKKAVWRLTVTLNPFFWSKDSSKHMICLYFWNQHIKDILITCFVFKNMFKQKSPLFLTAIFLQLELYLPRFCCKLC